MGNIAALILAAGFSTRMQGLFKPLLPLQFSWAQRQELSALECLIKLYSTCGIKHIFVVIGQKEPQALSDHISEITKKIPHINIHIVQNPDACRGMFSSICEGLMVLQEQMPRVSHCFINPVDIPLIRQCTIQNLLHAKNSYPEHILIPSYKDEKGHPPLLPTKFIPKILGHSGENGLQGAFNKLTAQSVKTADSHMLLDMDTTSDYAILQNKAQSQHILNPDEALELLHCLNVPQKGLDHAKAVASIAREFAKAYAAQSVHPHIDIELTTSGALLHDMCKQDPKHEQAAGKALRQMGFPALAPLIEEHNDCSLDASKAVSAKELIYLADKYVFGKDFVPLTQRFEQKLQQYGHIPEASLAINARMNRAKAMEARVRLEINIEPANIAKEVLS